MQELAALDDGYTSALAQVECARPLDRLRLAGGLLDRELAAAAAATTSILARLNVLELDATVHQRASFPFPTTVRTLDAIHLASALVLREAGQPGLVFASHDQQQRTAAQALGFALLG